jgi:hypothetical protein
MMPSIYFILKISEDLGNENTYRFFPRYDEDVRGATGSTCWRGPVLTHGKYKSQKVSEFSNFVLEIFILWDFCKLEGSTYNNVNYLVMEALFIGI